MVARLACKYEGGQIYWRGPDEVWFYKPRDEAETLAFVFRKSSERHKWFAPLALEYARQIEAAIAEYDADEDDNEEWRYETEMANG